MIYMSAASLLYQLRSIRSALRDHNASLAASQDTQFAEFRVNNMILEIEDASYLVSPEERTAP